MQFRTTGLLLLGAMALPTSGTAETSPAPAITRTVVAATKLPTVTDVPLHFKAVSITLQPDTKSSVSAANGILYQMSGSTEVALDGEAKTLNPGEGLFIAGGKTAALTAGRAGPSTFLHFFLAPAVDLGRPAETAPAAVSVWRVYRGPWQPSALWMGRRSRYQDIDGTFCKSLSHHSVTFRNGFESDVLLRAGS